MTIDEYIRVAWPSIVFGVGFGVIAEWASREFIGRRGAIVVGLIVCGFVGVVVARIRGKRAARELKRYEASKKTWG
jgi:hypothetical protein